MPTDAQNATILELAADMIPNPGAFVRMNFIFFRNRLLNLAVSLMRHRANRASTLYYQSEAKSHAGILRNAARRDTSPHHTAATSAAAPVEIAAVDDLRRSVEEVKRTVCKAKREIMRTPTPRARDARQRQENVDPPRVPRGVAGRQRRLSVTRGALRLLPQPQEQFLSTRASPRDKTAPVGKITHGFGTTGFSGTCAARNTKALTLLLSTAIRCYTMFILRPQEVLVYLV